MDTVRFDFYRQEYALLMRAIIRAVDALDKQDDLLQNLRSGDRPVRPVFFFAGL